MLLYMKVEFSGNNTWKENADSAFSFQVSANEVQVWYASLLHDPKKFLSLLSPDEKARAKRFYFENDRNRYIAGRGILRTLLGFYLRREPAAIEFIYGLHGKPAVKSTDTQKALQFNLAHSNDLAVYAFARDRLIGIDLEHVRPLQDADDFAERFFSTRESALISSMPADQKWGAFFKLWTCKEAFLKANGSGLTVPLNQAEILLGSSDDTVKLISIGGDLKGAANWQLETRTLAGVYRLAIAIERPEARLVLQQFETMPGRQRSSKEPT